MKKEFGKQLKVYVMGEGGETRELTGKEAERANEVADGNELILKGLAAWNQKMNAVIQSGSKPKAESKTKQVKPQQKRSIFSFLPLPTYTADQSNVSRVNPNSKPQNGMVVTGEDIAGKQKLVEKIKGGSENAAAYAKQQALNNASRPYTSTYDHIKDGDSKMGPA